MIIVPKDGNVGIVKYNIIMTVIPILVSMEVLFKCSFKNNFKYDNIFNLF